MKAQLPILASIVAVQPAFLDQVHLPQVGVGVAQLGATDQSADL